MNKISLTNWFHGINIHREHDLAWEFDHMLKDRVFWEVVGGVFIVAAIWAAIIVLIWAMA